MSGEEKYGGIVKEVHHTCDVRPTIHGGYVRDGDIDRRVVEGLIRRPEGWGPLGRRAGAGRERGTCQKTSHAT